MYSTKVTYVKEKIKSIKTQKVKCGVPFVDRLKAIEYTMGLFFLFIYYLLFYPSS